MKPALIIGRAACVWEDVFQANYILSQFDPIVIAVNVAGRDADRRLDHWVSYHPELFPKWIEQRRTNGFPDGYQLWTSSRGRRVTEWERKMGLSLVDSEGGSSGMIALRVALQVGATHIILAGIPMENSYGQYDTGKNWDEAEMHSKTWEKLPPDIQARVRSMSGWTRRQFGYPTELWLNGTYQSQFFGGLANDYCEQCFGPCLRRPRHGEFNI